MKKIPTALAVCAALFTLNSTVQAQSNKQCIPIGGTALGTVYDGNQIMAVNSGTWAAVRAEITSQKKTDTGLDLTMKHVYATADGAIVNTDDVAKFTTVAGKDNTFMVEIAYKIVSAKGSLAGYSVTFYSFGLIKTGIGKAVVRYYGEICK